MNKWEDCPETGLRRIRVLNGWLYEVDWQYDIHRDVQSVVGCYGVFIPNVIEEVDSSRFESDDYRYDIGET